MNTAWLHCDIFSWWADTDNFLKEGVAKVSEFHIMNNNTEDVNNKGYIFANLLDITLYGTIAVLFPMLNIIVSIFDTSFVGLQDMYDLLFAEFFVTATFFYDFYSRYRECEEQTEYVVNVLYYGRLLFFTATLLLLVLMFLVTQGMRTEDVETALKIIAFLGIYPVVFAIIEAFQRMRKEKRRKITKK